MIPRLAVAAILLFQATRAAEPIRPLTAGLPIHDSLAGGGRAVFSVDVPANTAARIVLDQEGVDLAITLRRQGSALPEHGLDLTAGIDGQEVSYPAIGDADATWNLTISTALPRAARGNYTIALELQPADDRNRAIALARAKYHAASDTAWGGDAKSFQQAVVDYAAAADAAEAAGDKALAAEATYQGARVHDSLGDAPGAIELQRKALTMFREIGRRDREARVLNRLGDLSRKVGEVTASESYFSQALPLARDAHDPANVADILNNSGAADADARAVRGSPRPAPVGHPAGAGSQFGERRDRAQQQHGRRVYVAGSLRSGDRRVSPRAGGGGPAQSAAPDGAHPLHDGDRPVRTRRSGRRRGGRQRGAGALRGRWRSRGHRGSACVLGPAEA